MNTGRPGWIQTVSLPPPSLQDNSADADRLVRVLKTQLKTDDIPIDLNLLKRLPRRLRNSAYKVKCILYKNRHQWIVIDIKEAQDASPLAGLAVDLGTTTVVLRLMDLQSGTVLSESSFHNPQLSIGPDILTRVHFAGEADGLARLHDLLIAALNDSIQTVCGGCGLRPDDIYFLSVAGNTVMTHLFLGLSPGGIIREPYIPVVNRPGLIPAPELGVAANPQAQVLIFPNAGSYFGGDLVAGILFSGLHRRSDTALLVDVGTNAEVVLGNRDWLVGCAGAAGPALEGGASQIGMLAGPGVIDHIERVPDENRFRCHTIDASPPRGICGSGLIELAALLFAAGMIDSRGRFVPENFRDRITYLELNVNQEFMARFSAARFLPHTDLSRFPSVKVRRRDSF